MARKIIRSKAIKAPARKRFHISMLPAELLATIFILATPRGGHSAKRKLSRHPLPLLRVCKAWMVVALRTPGLWTSIVLSPYSTKPGLIGSGVQQWFSRARDRPLFFSANLKPGWFLRTDLAKNVPWVRLTALEIKNDNMISPDTMLSVMMMCINLETCILSGIAGWSSKKKAIPSVKPVKLRHLRALTIEFESSISSPHMYGHTEIYWLLLPFIFPKLTSLKIRATDSSVDESLIAALLAMRTRSHFSLSHLHLGRVAFNCADLYKFLLASPGIRHLYLEGTQTPQLLTPLLKDLMVEGTQSRGILPKLEKLVIIDYSLDRDWPSLDALSLKFLESRSWRGEKRPYGNLGTGAKLRDVAIIWKSPSSFPTRVNNMGARRAKRLRDDGLLLFYPTLEMPRQKGSTLNVDFWWM